MNYVKLVTYDLSGEGDYDKLLSFLRKFCTYTKITESTCLVDTDMSCKQLQDEIRKIVSKGDRIFVTEIAGESAWWNAITDSHRLSNCLRSKFF